MPEARTAPPSVTDSPWFWVMLFSLAGLAGLFTIGPKFEQREAAIEENFHARERAAGLEAKENVPDGGAIAEDRSASDTSSGPQNATTPWRPIFTLTPIAVVLAAIAVVAMFNVMRYHRRQLIALRQAHIDESSC
jgi:hypothetical protein